MSTESEILRFVGTNDCPRVDSNKDDLLVGRHSEADLQLPMPDVSRRHCRFVRTETGWRVIDLASTNGTFVNGVRVQEAELHAGDRIRIGGVVIEVAGGGEARKSA
jgi:pSer/pThr/pTyr-binding forkhead associated (FHA) protein